MNTTNDSHNQIGLHINIASHLLRRKMDAFSAPFGLSGIQTRILHHLEMAEAKGTDVFQRDLEKQFAIRRSSVTSVISNLEQNGYVTRTAVSGDARLKKLTLTEKGCEVNRSMALEIRDFEQSLSDLFSPEQQELFIDLLHTLITALDESEKNTDN